jgi:hypothetical protein
VKHSDSNGLSNGNNGVSLNGNGTAEGTSPHHSEREDMKFWENDHFTDLRKRWEKGEIEEGEIALVRFEFYSLILMAVINLGTSFKKRLA